MTAALIVTVWVCAPIVVAALVIAAGSALDARRRRRAVRDLAVCRAILAASPESCPEHGHACQPHDHQNPGGTR